MHSSLRFLVGILDVFQVAFCVFKSVVGPNSSHTGLTSRMHSLLRFRDGRLGASSAALRGVAKTAFFISQASICGVFEGDAVVREVKFDARFSFDR